jgi:hypothetical protein
MNMKLNWKPSAFIGMAFVVATAAIGISFACNTASGRYIPEFKSLGHFSWVESNDNHKSRPGIDIGDNGKDPVETQRPNVSVTRVSTDIANTVAYIKDKGNKEDTIKIDIDNCYPGYCPTIFFGVVNQTNIPGMVKSINILNPQGLPVTIAGIQTQQFIEPGREYVGWISVPALDNIKQGYKYSFSVDILIAQSIVLPVLEITTTSLPDGEIGILYFQELTAARGKAPYSWSLISGNLPSGLSIGKQTGIISGIPKKTGTSNFEVRVTDRDGKTATKSLSIQIKEHKKSR